MQRERGREKTLQMTVHEFIYMCTVRQLSLSDFGLQIYLLLKMGGNEIFLKIILLKMKINSHSIMIKRLRQTPKCSYSLVSFLA